MEREIAFMGEHASIHTPVEEEATMADATRILRMFADRIYPLIDIYAADSEISRANQIAARTRFPISRDTQYLVEHAQQLSANLDGAFDISDAPLRHLWNRHFRNDPQALPAEPLVRATRRGVGPHHFEVRDHALLLLTSVTQLDVNEFARPYVIDRAIRHMRRQGVGHVLIEMGDFGRCLGRASADQSWFRTIMHPAEQEREVGGVLLPDGAAFAMVGWPHHYADVGGERVARVIDPRSGWPAEGETSVLVIGPSVAGAYALAQALFIDGRDEGMAHLQAMPRYQALFVQHDEPSLLWHTPDFAPLFDAAPDYRDKMRLLERPVEESVEE